MSNISSGTNRSSQPTPATNAFWRTMKEKSPSPVRRTTPVPQPLPPKEDKPEEKKSGDSNNA